MGNYWLDLDENDFNTSSQEDKIERYIYLWQTSKIGPMGALNYTPSLAWHSSMQSFTFAENKEING